MQGTLSDGTATYTGVLLAGEIVADGLRHGCPPEWVGLEFWLDQDGDGAQALREVGLKLRTGQFVAQTVTSDAGLYSFAQLLPGGYSVCVDTPPGHVRTRPAFSSCSSVMLGADRSG